MVLNILGHLKLTFNTREGFLREKHSCGFIFQNCAIHQYS